MASCVVLCSGGINSAVAAFRAGIDRDVFLLHVDFGQDAASRQRESVRELAGALGGEVIEVDLPHHAKLAQLRRPSASRQDEESENSAATPTPTVSSVPMLMAELLGVAVQAAARIGAEAIVVGSSEAANEIETQSAPGEGTPHHRRDYYYLFNLLTEMSLGAKQQVKLETPLIDLARDEIIKLGTRFDTPFDLTHACQSDAETHCGTCPDCKARDRAFEQAGLLDPAASRISG